MSRLTFSACIALSSACLLAPGIGFAVDGVIEINQARALAGGVTASDTPGFPVTIDGSGSYRLTSNLDVTAGSSAIWIDGDDVNLDFNGFSVLGNDPDYGTGVRVQGANARIHDGTVRGLKFGVKGVGTGLRMDHMTITNNGENGIGETGFLLSSVVITNSTVSGNDERGIWVDSDAVIADCMVRDNGLENIRAEGARLSVTRTSVLFGGLGIYAFGGGSSVTGSTIVGNGQRGVQMMGGGSAVRNSVVQDNGAIGIWFGGDDALAEGNTVKGNGSSGIYITGKGGVVDGNIIANSGFSGIFRTGSGQKTAVRDNTIYDNPSGWVNSSALFVQTGGNACDGGTSCP